MDALRDYNEEIRGKNALEDSIDNPIFTLDHRTDLISRGRGYTVAFTVSNDTVFVATSRNFLLRHDLLSAEISELEFPKLQESSIRRLFVDSTGSHVLICLQASGNAGVLETHYLDAAWKKTRPITKLKGVAVTSVAWSTLGADSPPQSIVGTATGALYEVIFDDGTAKKKDLVSHLMDLQQEARPIAALAVLAPSLSSPYRLLVALCGTSLYILKLPLDPAPHNKAHWQLSNTVELPLSSPGAQLQFLPGHTPQQQAFAILSLSGVYIATLKVEAKTDSEVISESVLLPPDVFQQPSTAELPLSMGLTQHHVALLFPSRLLFVNRIGRTAVQEIPLDRFASPMRGAPALPLGLARDTASERLYVLAGDDCWEVDTHDEDRDMWRIFLNKGDYKNALSYCATSRQRNTVYLSQGEALLDEGKAGEAAPVLGKMTSALPSFEELALTLSEQGGADALSAFLQSRLDTLGSNDAAQATMVATWLTELHLDILNRALLEQRNGTQPQRNEDLPEALRVRDFLTKYVDVLDPGTTISLLAGYGRTKELTHYARCRGDSEAVLEHLLAAGEAERALEVLRKPSVSDELTYKFAPALVAAAPEATIQAWIDAYPPLNPRRLLPALLHLGELANPNCQVTIRKRNEALKYIRHCIFRLGTSDTAVHNCMVALLSIDDSNEPLLLEYLSGSGRGALGRPLFDPVHALRLVKERGRKRAAVALMVELGLLEDAVELGLQFDKMVACDVARQAGDSAPLKRKLWLTIARHIIDIGGNDTQDSQKAAILKATALLEESDGALHIEDILPFFPDFVEIDAFKDTICASLERYNKEIEELKAEMALASETAQVMREGLVKLENRCATLDISELCARCGRPLSQPPPGTSGPSGGAMPKLFLFSTGNVFHGSCLSAEVIALSPSVQANHIRGLVRRLVASSPDAPVVAELRVQLEREICSEDPYNGELVTRNIIKPFVSDEDRNGWDL